MFFDRVGSKARTDFSGGLALWSVLLARRRSICLRSALPMVGLHQTISARLRNVENDPNVWTGCISQLKTCGIAELADMYPGRGLDGDTHTRGLISGQVVGQPFGSSDSGCVH
jgi:hypothetical protein